MTPTQLDERTIPRHKATLKRNELSLPRAANIDGGYSNTTTRTWIMDVVVGMMSASSKQWVFAPGVPTLTIFPESKKWLILSP
jgi:hypothetical protein